MGNGLVNLGGLCDADLTTAEDDRLVHLLRAALGHDVHVWPDIPDWESSISNES